MGKRFGFNLQLIIYQMYVKGRKKTLQMMNSNSIFSVRLQAAVQHGSKAPSSSSDQIRKPSTSRLDSCLETIQVSISINWISAFSHQCTTVLHRSLTCFIGALRQVKRWIFQKTGHKKESLILTVLIYNANIVCIKSVSLISPCLYLWYNSS